MRAERSGSPFEVEGFIRAYPKSVYVAEARRVLDDMRRADDDGWREAIRGLPKPRRTSKPA